MPTAKVRRIPAASSGKSPAPPESRALTNHRPSGLTLARETVAPAPVKAATPPEPSAFHRLAAVSDSGTVSTRMPSGVKCAVGAPMPRGRNVTTDRPARTSQMRMVPSRETLSRRLPSSANSTAVTGCVWPASRRPADRPETGCIVTAPSSHPTASCNPSWEKAALVGRRGYGSSASGTTMPVRAPVPSIPCTCTVPRPVPVASSCPLPLTAATMMVPSGDVTFAGGSRRSRCQTNNPLSTATSGAASGASASTKLPGVLKPNACRPSAETFASRIMISRDDSIRTVSRGPLRASSAHSVRPPSTASAIRRRSSWLNTSARVVLEVVDRSRGALSASTGATAMRPPLVAMARRRPSWLKRTAESAFSPGSTAAAVESKS